MSSQPQNKKKEKSKHLQRSLSLDSLEILRLHSDAEHPMTQKEILDKLKESPEYDENAGGKKLYRGKLKSHLELLRNTEEYPVSYPGAPDEWSDDEEDEEKKEKVTNLFYQHPFTYEELCFLIDCIMFTSGLDEATRKALIQKLKGLSSKHFADIIRYSDWNVQDRVENKDLLEISKILHKAIAEEKKVCFQYCDCNQKFTLQPRIDSDGSIKNYVVSPYQLVTANGRPYLVGYHEARKELTHFRLDRIKNIWQTNEVAVHVQGMRLSEYLAQHPNLWSGEALSVTFLCPQGLMNDVADWFGKTASIFPQKDGSMKVVVKISKDAMLHWALQYADCVEIIKPESLRKEITDKLQEALQKYQ